MADLLLRHDRLRDMGGIGVAVMTKWTEEQDAKLREGIAENRAFSQMAMEIGVSRNAAIGRAHRLGLKGNPVGQHKEPKQRTSKLYPDRQFKPYTKKSKMIIQQLQLPIIECVPLNISFMEITNKQCRFIPGEPDGANTLYCGHPVIEEGQPYCASHYVLCHGRWERTPTAQSVERERRKRMGKAIVLADGEINLNDPEEQAA